MWIFACQPKPPLSTPSFPAAWCAKAAGASTRIFMGTVPDRFFYVYKLYDELVKKGNIK